MSVATEISRLQTAKADLKTAIEAKGVTVPSSAKLDDYPDYVAQIEGGGGQGNPLFTNYLRGDGRAYIDTGINLSGNPFEISAIAGNIGRLRQEEVIFSNWIQNYGYFNIFFTGGETDRRVDAYLNGHNYLNATGWFDFYPIVLAYDGNGTYTLSVGDNTITISKPNANPTTLKLFVRGDLNSTTPSTTMLKTVTIKYGPNLANIKTLRPCIYNGVAGMWDVELNQFHGNDNSVGMFFVE